MKEKTVYMQIFTNHFLSLLNYSEYLPSIKPKLEGLGGVQTKPVFKILAIRPNPNSIINLSKCLFCHRISFGKKPLRDLLFSH